METRQRTYVAKNEEMGQEWTREWWIIDARGQTLGRMASRIALVLMGKHKPIYTPHVDVGDYVVVINAAEIDVTGNKPQSKLYHSYSGYPGGLRSRPFNEVVEKHPTKPVYEAVRRMLPKSKLGDRMLKKLRVYAGEEHPHQPQQPQPLDL